MKKDFIISDGLSIEYVKKSKRTITTIILNGERIVLGDIKTDNYFWSKVVFDENYIVVYTRGCVVNPIPISIEAVYDIKEKRVLDLSNEKLKVLLEYMFISKKVFKLTNILTFINSEDLNILADESKDDLKRILTCGNKKITDAEVVEYILDKYPVLAKYRNLKGALTFLDYETIVNEIRQEYFEFHLMPQNLSYLEDIIIEDKNTNNRNFYQIYAVEYEHQQRVLRLEENKR